MHNDLSNFFRERYDYEALRRSELNGALAMPAGVLSVLIGSIVFILKDLHAPLIFNAIIQLILCGLCGISCAISAFFLIRSIFNYKYLYLASARDISDYYNRLLAFYQADKYSNGPLRAEQLSLRDTLDYISERYVVCAHSNTINNDNKSWNLHRATSSMIFALVFGAISGIFYIQRSICQPISSANIEVVNLKEVLPMSEPSEPQRSQDPKNPPSPPPPNVSKPTPPPDRIVKEGGDPNKVRKPSR